MPYYQWKGLDLTGATCQGKQFAVTKHALEQRLLEDNVAIFYVETAITPTASVPGLSRFEICSFFKQLGLMVKTGVFLTDALRVLHSQASSKRVACLIAELTTAVQNGSSLSEALSLYPKNFDALIVAMVKAGELSGSLGTALERISVHRERMEGFYKKIRSVALMPLITVLFFLVIVNLILMFIVPYFAQIIRMSGKDMPWATGLLIHMSEWLTMPVLGCFFGGIIMVLVIIRYCYQRGFMTYAIDYGLVRTPGVSSFIRNIVMVHFLEALSLLLQGGAPLVGALKVSAETVKNSIVRYHIDRIILLVEEGSDLSQACKSAPVWLIEHEFITMVKVGQESGRVATMIARAAQLYEARVSRALDLYTTLFQPLLLLVLGLMVAFLVFAVYVPIFTLSDTIGFHAP